MEVGIRVETEYSRSYTEDIILDIDIIQIWKRRYFSRLISAPFLFRTSVTVKLARLNLPFIRGRWTKKKQKKN